MQYCMRINIKFNYFSMALTKTHNIDILNHTTLSTTIYLHCFFKEEIFFIISITASYHFKMF
jgi:hypothetical protein